MFMFILNSIYAVIIYVFMTYIILTLLLSIKTPKKNIGELQDFEYYVLVPGYNEELVIGDTVRDLLKFGKNVHVLAIDDESQDKTLSILEQIKSSRLHIIRRKSPRAHIGKGDALNQALAKVLELTVGKDKDKIIIGVVDADGKLSYNAFEELDKEFSDPKVSTAQLRVKMFSDFNNTLQVEQDLEFFTVGNMSQRERSNTNSVGLSGNGQFFRLKPIMDEIGIDPWGDALLDDYEMTLKLMMHGLKINYVDTAYVNQQSVQHIKPLVKQRSRWVQGNLDCLPYLPSVRMSKHLNSLQRMEIYYFLAQPFINLVADLLIFFLSCYVVIQRVPMPPIMQVLSVLAMSMIWGVLFTVLYLIDLKKFKEKMPKPWQILFLPIVVSYMYIILFFSIMIAFIRHIKKDRSWIKTQRNV